MLQIAYAATAARPDNSMVRSLNPTGDPLGNDMVRSRSHGACRAGIAAGPSKSRGRGRVGLHIGRLGIQRVCPAALPWLPPNSPMRTCSRSASALEQGLPDAL